MYRISLAKWIRICDGSFGDSGFAAHRLINSIVSYSGCSDLTPRKVIRRAARWKLCPRLFMIIHVASFLIFVFLIVACSWRMSKFKAWIKFTFRFVKITEKKFYIIFFLSLFINFVPSQEKSCLSSTLQLSMREISNRLEVTSFVRMVLVSHIRLRRRRRGVRVVAKGKVLRRWRRCWLFLQVLPRLLDEIHLGTGHGRGGDEAAVFGADQA